MEIRSFVSSPLRSIGPCPDGMRPTALLVAALLLNFATFGASYADTPRKAKESVRSEKSFDGELDRAANPNLTKDIRQLTSDPSINSLAQKHRQLVEKINALQFQVTRYGKSEATRRSAKSLLETLQAQQDARDHMQELRDREQQMMKEKLDAQEDESTAEADEAREKDKEALRLLIDHQQRMSQVLQKLAS